MKQLIHVSRTQEILSLITDVAYSRVPSWYGCTMRDLKMDLIVPKYRQGHTPCPTIVWICGGAFCVMDRSVWIPVLTDFARRGFVVASVEYRTCNEGAFPMPLIDVKSAIRFLRANAESLCVNPAKICVMGESAGGSLACFAGVTGERTEFDQGDNLSFSSSVQAVVDFYGRPNMADMPSDSVNADIPHWIYRALMDSGFTREKLSTINALSYISEKTPPFLIFHGTDDNAVPIRQSDYLYEALMEKNIDTSYYVVEGAVHGDDLFFQEPIIQIVCDFLNCVL